MKVTVCSNDPACAAQAEAASRALGYDFEPSRGQADVAIVDCAGGFAERTSGSFEVAIAVRAPGDAAAQRALFAAGIHEVLPGELDLSRLQAALLGAESRLLATRAAQDALLESESRFEALLDTTVDLVSVVELDGTMRRHNSAHERLLGYGEDELAGSNVWQLVHPDDLLATQTAFRRAVTGEYQPTITFRLRHKDGSWVPFEAGASLLRSGGEVTGAVVVSSDVTRLTHAAEVIDELEDRFTKAFNLNPLPSVITEVGTRVIVSANQRFEEISGWPAEELIGHTASSLGIWANMEHRNQVVSATDRREAVAGFETQLRRRDGELRDVRLYAGRFIAAGHAEGLTVVEDISGEKQAREALDRLTTTLAVQQETSLDGILVVGPAGEVMSYNQRYLEMWSLTADDVAAGLARRTEVANSVLADPEAAIALVDDVYASPDKLLHHHVAMTDGRTLELYTAPLSGPEGANFGRVWYYRDITERLNAEAERLDLERKLLESQKLESLGVLAGGIAHDFNNLLVAIMGNAGLATIELADDSPIRPYLVEIEEASQRAADLARQMLAYSGKGRVAADGVDLTAVIEELAHRLPVSLPPRVEVVLELSPSLPLTRGDASQVRQIVMNLVLNAGEAIGDATGTITVATAVVNATSRDFAACVLAPELQPGRYIRLDVIDDGCGMDAETMKRIFEPFFTTKFVGRGLGLAAVLGIVRGHRGAMRVESAPGRGTVFRVYLPIATEDVRTPASR